MRSPPCGACVWGVGGCVGGGGRGQGEHGRDGSSNSSRGMPGGEDRGTQAGKEAAPQHRGPNRTLGPPRPGQLLFCRAFSLIWRREAGRGQSGEQQRQRQRQQRRIGQRDEQGLTRALQRASRRHPPVHQPPPTLSKPAHGTWTAPSTQQVASTQKRWPTPSTRPAPGAHLDQLAAQLVGHEVDGGVQVGLRVLHPHHAVPAGSGGRAAGEAQRQQHERHQQQQRRKQASETMRGGVPMMGEPMLGRERGESLLPVPFPAGHALSPHPSPPTHPPSTHTHLSVQQVTSTICSRWW